MNSSKQITESRNVKFTKATGPEVLELIKTKAKTRGQTEMRPAK